MGRGLAPGAYEAVITRAVESLLASVDATRTARAKLDPADAHEVLARHISELARRALVGLSGDSAEAVKRQVLFTNRVVAALSDLTEDVDGAPETIPEPHELLQAIVAAVGVPGPVIFPARPEIPLSASALLVNGRQQPRIGSEVQRELETADSVDLLCAFIKWYGLRVIEDQIGSFVRRGGRLRVITTTYMGATERRAIDRLIELGATVRISYETRTTRLHAKAWLFDRASGYSTAYVGSSNLSRAALLDGLEWNVRLSAVQQPHLLDTFRATFDEYWADPGFELYDPTSPDDVKRLDDALGLARDGKVFPVQLAAFDIRPWGYQQEVLDDLQSERDLHGHWRNLVVMATGTGKTIVAALDYRRLRDGGKVDSLLFVAHREEILDQSLATFRHVMHDGAFGERFVAGERPREWRHVFASVQSLARLDLDKELDAARFDMVIVDEFHHASESTPTYTRLLRHIQPNVLLGLTATPERADGLDVKIWFDGRIASELRLWEALERGLLSPFQYFGIHDMTDLRGIRWKRGVGYAPDELTNLYTGHDARLRVVLQSLHDKVTDIGHMRALGFCVGIEHAEYMARKFNEAGIPSLAVTSKTAPGNRDAALRALRDRSVNILFTVDLFNEGVDIPNVDTVLFLRPTESATVFLQQLGRGLRLAADKACLTVLDFIGNQNADFRFDLRYRALTGSTRRGLVQDIDRGFPTLPPGCHIALDRVASQIVLDNIRATLRASAPVLVRELRQVGDVTLQQFLEETGHIIEDVYRPGRGGWAHLRRLAGFETRPVSEDDDAIAAGLTRLTHIDDAERIELLEKTSTSPAPPSLGQSTRTDRLLAMLHFSLWGAGTELETYDSQMAQLWNSPARLDEMAQLAVALRERLHRVTRPLDSADIPLALHGTYTRDEALAAFGVPNPDSVRQGVKWVKDERSDVFFVTLRKTEKHYSPTTMYQDRAISPVLFQWESQSTTSEQSPTGQRYIHQRTAGASVHFFIRDSKEGEDGRTPPYFYAGRASYVSHSSDRPLRIIWKLEQPLPADIFHAARVALA